MVRCAHRFISHRPSPDCREKLPVCGRDCLCVSCDACRVQGNCAGNSAVPVRGPWSMCPETVQLSVSIDWCSVQLSQQLLLLCVMCWVHLSLTLLHCRILEGVESAQSLPREELSEHLYHPTNALTQVQRYHREWN